MSENGSYSSSAIEGVGGAVANRIAGGCGAAVAGTGCGANLNAGGALGSNTTVNASDLKISANTVVLEDNIKILNNIIDQLQSAWSDIKGNQIEAINASWAGSVAKEYTDRVLSMEPKINASKDALKLISDTYTKAVNEINDKQEELRNKIKG